MPMVTVLFILAIGNLLNVGFEKALLMQTPLNLANSEIIQDLRLPRWSAAGSVQLLGCYRSVQLRPQPDGAAVDLQPCGSTGQTKQPCGDPRCH